MKTINYISCALLVMCCSIMQAQKMRWIPAPNGSESCPNQASEKFKTISYVLEYTPNVSGTLTSYTTGFLVSCTSAGSAVVKNQSRAMTSKSREISGCNTMGAVLMNSSGNTGDAIHNKVEVGVPVILHQICLSIPFDEAVTIKEDEVTDLTTSIDIGNGQFTTEFPTFVAVTVGKIRPDEGRPMHVLDFKGIPAGNLISQLDWSVTEMVSNTPFSIERSVDGEHFTVIGTTDKGEKSGHISTFQFFDREAILGDNYYRLTLSGKDGKNEYSPVRIVNFASKSLSAHFTPNPANDFLEVKIDSPEPIKSINLVDATGRVVMNEKDGNLSYNVRLDVRKLTAGVYTLVVDTDHEKFTDSVVITH